MDLNRLVYLKTYENTVLLDTFSSVESSNITDTTNCFVEEVCFKNQRRLM